MRTSDIVFDEIDLALPAGSLAAFIENARAAQADAAADEALRDLQEMIPLLRRAGVFEVFSLRDQRLQSLLDQAA
ncbi:MAG: hypothetical protein IT546_12730 [Caulobacteraceae bacterium]|nr:hypothetical protein [Caulobacteraceae bacterium]